MDDRLPGKQPHPRKDNYRRRLKSLQHFHIKQDLQQRGHLRLRLLTRLCWIACKYQQLIRSAIVRQASEGRWFAIRVQNTSELPTLQWVLIWKTHPILPSFMKTLLRRLMPGRLRKLGWKTTGLSTSALSRRWMSLLKLLSLLGKRWRKISATMPYSFQI